MKGLRFLIITGLMLAIFAMVGTLAVGQFIDMEVVDVSVWPSQEQGIYGGMVPTFYANVTNNGTETGLDVEIYMFATGPGGSDQMAGSPHTVGEFHPGVTLQFQSPWQIGDISEQDGSQTFILNCSVEVDGETEADDNEDEINVDVQPNAADIVIEIGTDYKPFNWFIDHDRTGNHTVITDTYVWVSATIYNVGTKNANGVTIYFAFDGKPIGSTSRSVSATSSKPSTPTNASVKWKTPADTVTDGQLHVYVVEDRDISPGDNDAYHDVDVIDPTPSDLADFAVTILKPETSDDVYSYAAIEVKVAIANEGYRSTGVSGVDVEFWAGVQGALTIQDTKSIELSAQQRPETNVYNLKFIWRVEVDPDVRAEIEIIVDPDDEFSEGNEGNNDASRNWMVEEARPEDHPQLRLQSVQFIAPNGSYMDDQNLRVFPGFPITFHMNIRNYGVMPVSEVPVYVWYGDDEDDWENGTYVGAPEIKYQSGKGGSSYSTKPLVFTWTTSESLSDGDYWFIFYIDPYNNTDHFNETDEHGDPNRDDNLVSYDFKYKEKNLADLTYGDIRMEYVKDPVIFDEEITNNTAYYGGRGFGPIEIFVEIENLGDVTETFVVQWNDSFFNYDVYANAPDNADSDARNNKTDIESVGASDSIWVKFTWHEWMRVGEAGVHTFNLSITAANAEKNSTNNHLSFEVLVVNKGLADLVVVTDGDSPYEIAPDFITDNTINATIIVPIKNIGPRSTRDEFKFTLKWENKAGTIGDRITDIAGRNEWTIDVLLAENEQTTKTITWPWYLNLTGSGKYNIVCNVDTDEDIREEDEDNNEEIVLWTIKVDRADIEVTEDDIDISMHAFPITVGTETTEYLVMGSASDIDVTVHNEGTADVTEDIIVEATFIRQRDGEESDPVTATIVDGIEAEGGMETVTLTWTPAVSSAEYITELWTMYLVVPDDLEFNPYGETRLDNQAPQYDITVIQSLADPAVFEEDIVTDDPAYFNVPQPINVSVMNSGPANVAGVTVSIEAGTSLDNETTVDIASGQTVLFQWIWTPKKIGTADITVRVEMPDETDEISDENNFARTSVEVIEVSSPELSISDSTIAINPGEPQTGKEADINVIVSNNGGESASSIQVQLFVDGSEEATGIIDSIGSKGYDTITFTWKAGKVGTHNLTVIVDPNEQIDDPVRSNNEANLEFEVVSASKPPSEDDADPTIYIIAAVAIGIGSAGAILFLMRKKA